MAISANQIVQVLPRLLTGTGKDLQFNGLVLDKSNLIPVDEVYTTTGIWLADKVIYITIRNTRSNCFEGVLRLPLESAGTRAKPEKNRVRILVQVVINETADKNCLAGAGRGIKDHFVMVSTFAKKTLLVL